MFFIFVGNLVWFWFFKMVRLEGLGNNFFGMDVNFFIEGFVVMVMMRYFLGEVFIR